ncbi:GNAT family N-acetyltransferase [Pontibacter flavimaris]|uniref:Phosphinothricin acetyltransferase n=1 Tax=Pontibacter flavimaris TaxID=1797110 RepID=A0A1Q5PIB1_9BACT|nr:GNAT family N-acetyltransferase [Pontibacter flavimaris]OKL41959.1 phosphinothricin acetyltransferase [Pontibacter flavimaris]
METATQHAVLLTEMLPVHYPQVKEIYEQGIATNNATLETKAPDWEEWDSKYMKSCRLVALAEDGSIAGWAALTAVSGRCVYRGVAENSVYIHPKYKGRGIGRLLLQQLVQESEQEGIWTLQAHMLKENEASVRLHEQCGFKIVGLRERFGQLHGQWRDTWLMEKRSKVVGV